MRRSKTSLLRRPGCPGAWQPAILPVSWHKRTFPSSPHPPPPRPLYRNEFKCSAFGMEIIFHSHGNKTYFQKKGCALGLVLKVRQFLELGTGLCNSLFLQCASPTTRSTAMWKVAVIFTVCLVKERYERLLLLFKWVHSDCDNSFWLKRCWCWSSPHSFAQNDHFTPKLSLCCLFVMKRKWWPWPHFFVVVFYLLWLHKKMDSPTNPHLGLAPIIPWEQRFLSRMAKYRLQGRLRGLHCLSLSCFVAADMPREQLRKR